MFFSVVFCDGLDFLKVSEVLTFLTAFPPHLPLFTPLPTKLLSCGSGGKGSQESKFCRLPFTKQLMAGRQASEL